MALKNWVYAYTHKGYPWFIAMQGAGNLVVYDSEGNGYWASNTAGNPGAWVTAQSDGNVVIYNAKSEWIWQTETAGGTKITLLDQEYRT
jgi:hypothetical protein